MLRQEERVIRLDQLLRNRERTTAQYLADELEVSERTVRADIAFVRERLQAPILYGKEQVFNWLPLVISERRSSSCHCQA